VNAFFCIHIASTKSNLKRERHRSDITEKKPTIIYYRMSLARKYCPIIVDSPLLNILKESVRNHIDITDPSLEERNELGNILRSFPALLFHDSITTKTREQKHY